MLLTGGLVTVAGDSASALGTDSFTFTGTATDPITHGQSLSFDQSTATITGATFGDGETVNLFVLVPGAQWVLSVSAPLGQKLTAGRTYQGSLTQTDSTGFMQFFGGEFSSGFISCDQTSGSFTVQRASFGPHGWIEDFAVTWDQHCAVAGFPDDGSSQGAASFGRGPAPAELVVTLSPATTDVVSKTTGRATVTGSVTCSKRVDLNLDLSLLQRKTRTVQAVGSASLFAFPCSPTARTWSATVIPASSVPFSTGKADLTGSWNAFDPDYALSVSGGFGPLTVMLK